MIVICLIKNEMINLPEFIKMNATGNELLFVDDFSSDGSFEYVSKLGFQVVRNAFQSFSDQRNFALNAYAKEIAYGGGCLFLDADEWLTSDLSNYINTVLESEDSCYVSIPPLNIMSGTPIPKSSRFPVFHDRFFKYPILGRFETIYGGHIEGFKADSSAYERVETLNHYVHNAYSKGGSAWFKKHVDLADLESAATSQDLVKARRKHQVMYYTRKFYLSPFLRFVYHYFVCRGFLEGKAGFLYAFRYMIYEFLILASKIEGDLNNEN